MLFPDPELFVPDPELFVPDPEKVPDLTGSTTRITNWIVINAIN